MRSTQIAKEMRQLAWPWTILTFTGLVVLARPWFGEAPSFMTTGPWKALTEWMLPVGTFFGTSLLAALPLGSEFQFRTLAMRFAQPVDRKQLWQQKFLVTLAAAVPPAILYCVAIAMRYGPAFWLVTASWMAMTIAGAIPFTLLARSTMGGMMLSSLGTTGVTFAWMYYEKHGHMPPLLLAALAMGLVAYCGGMIWLGRRMLLRFQAVEGMQAGEEFVPGSRWAPRAVEESLRCRPRQPIANLVRRELRLLRSLWPLVLLNVAAWNFLVAFDHLPKKGPDAPHVVFALTMMLGLLITVLAGALSLGEEKAWGTHDWHMTLPVSVSVQWGAKLLTAVGVSVACAALLPMLVVVVGGWIGGQPWYFLSGEIALVWIAEAAGLTFAAFWCACVVRSTVQAVLWMFPVCAGLMFSGTLPWLLAESVNLRPVFADLVAKTDPIAFMRTLGSVLNLFMRAENLMAASVVPLLMAGLIQSRRLFRAQLAANRLRVLRCAAPLLAICFLCGAVGVTFTALLLESWNQQDTILRETHAAIEMLHPEGKGPQRLTATDLAKVAKLSEGTQRWLRDARIIVVSEPMGNTRNGPAVGVRGGIWRTLPGAPNKAAEGYSALIQGARGGSNCAFRFASAPKGNPALRYGILVGTCD